MLQIKFLVSMSTKKNLQIYDPVGNHVHDHGLQKQVQKIARLRVFLADMANTKLLDLPPGKNVQREQPSVIVKMESTTCIEM